ncbi:hypothetical protein V1477_009028 [Vespula maculifrons]|uniref:Transmembrane protein n=1 Tax=Vespula maculifrons TaxID=7453 RepID=A0ABD2CF45_VESMC
MRRRINLQKHNFETLNILMKFDGAILIILFQQLCDIFKTLEYTFTCYFLFVHYQLSIYVYRQNIIINMCIESVLIFRLRHSLLKTASKVKQYKIDFSSDKS